MTELSPTYRRDLTAPGWPWEALEDLEAQELRLYALGWGDHLPLELRERIEAIRRRKLALEAELEARLQRQPAIEPRRPLEAELP